jgi:hypothetical protein
VVIALNAPQHPTIRASIGIPPLKLYLDQNYLSGIAKGKPAFRELEPVLRRAVDQGIVEVIESSVHERESRPRPDLGLLELLRELTGGRRFPSTADQATRVAQRRMAWTIEHEFPERRTRHSDAADLEAIAAALVNCDLVTCDAFIADVIRRARLDLSYGCELFTGRRADALRLRDRLARLRADPGRTASGGCARQTRRTAPDSGS